MSGTIDIHGYSNSGPNGSRPRRPLVHILGSHHGDIQSFAFHPDDAPAIAQAILSAARAVTRGRAFNKSIPLLLSE